MIATSLLAPLTGGFGASATIALVLIGGACGAVGIWVMHFGNAILAESFSHALLPGMVLAVTVGASAFLGAIAGVAVAYLLLLVAMRAPRTSTPAAHSVTVTTLLAAGALLATRGRGVEGFEDLLFGDPLVAGEGGAASAAVLAIAIAAALVALNGQLSALAFDPGAAPALGVRSGAITAAALALLAVSVSVAANVAGTLLALALITAPAFGAAALSRRIGDSLLRASLAGGGSALVGLYVSYYADLPPAASIALVACTWAALATVVGGGAATQG